MFFSVAYFISPNAILWPNIALIFDLLPFREYNSNYCFGFSSFLFILMLFLRNERSGIFRLSSGYFWAKGKYSFFEGDFLDKLLIALRVYPGVIGVIAGRS